MVIAQRAVEQLALHAVAVTAAMVATRRIRRTHPTLRRVAAGAVRAVAAADPVAAQDRVGHEQVRPFRTRLPKC